VVFPKNIAEKLGFDQVLEHATLLCESERAKGHLQRVRFSNNKEQILLWLKQTHQCAELIRESKLNLNIAVDFDLKEKSARISGFFYEAEDLVAILDVLRTLKKATDFATHTDDYEELTQLFEVEGIDYDLIDGIERIIDAEGAVKPNASRKLQKISAEIRKTEQSVTRRSQKLFSDAKDKGVLGDTELGIKNGRLVLPVLSEHKRKIDGLLIDQSGTGKISYIEPLELVGLNNQLAELNIKQRQEIIAILRELTQRIVGSLDGIKRGIQRLVVFDSIRAKARLALDWEAVLPKVSDRTSVYQGIHPLLRLRLKEEGKPIVPVDYELNEDQRLIVISGPNAGGKSVALKTIGLLQYMLQCGFLVPCREASTFRIYKHIFIDIGDNQSIESDLSTYSSHLKAAKHIINFSNEDTLVLMDEIGTGTDPMFGGPMAEAILEFIDKKKAQGVITTHFSNIKSKAKKLKNVVNAAMLFDVENLKPLYKLEVGQPGSSFVYELAASIGLNKKLIKRANALTQTKQYDLDKLLAEVQQQKEMLNDLEEELELREENAARYEKEYLELKHQLEEQKKAILNKAKQEAELVIKGANKEIEKTIREIKESGADKLKTKRARQRLEKQKEKNSASNESEEEKPSFKVGDRVQIIGTDTIGEVLEIKKNRVALSVGSLTTKTNVSKIQKVGINKEAKKAKKYISERSFNTRQADFKTELDIRGMRTYDALQAVDTWIDSALILGFTNLRLLHGKGDGILKQEVRRHLKPNTAIASIQYERVDLGGEGVSLITLK
jgi:DNA mismatch repair protein MutS2